MAIKIKFTIENEVSDEEREQIVQILKDVVTKMSIIFCVEDQDFS